MGILNLTLASSLRIDDMHMVEHIHHSSRSLS